MATSKRTKRATRRSGRKRGGEPLEEYRRKRDFRKTKEPAGERKAQEPAARKRKARRDELQFVIQKHDATSLHYDLRLELDGVMRSWAVPKGPSLDPSVKRLAMQVEDHPIEYNTFEGTIPAGEYGGGTVMLWDRGTYSPDEPKQDEEPADAVRRGLDAGKLSFTFRGERLHGSFALVRTSRGEKPKWLLIKHRDETARADGDITAEVLTSVDTGRTMEEIAAESDRVWRSNRGGSKGGEERGSPAVDADTIAPMRPKPASKLPDDGDWMYEPWRGGTHVLAYVTPDGARLVDARAQDVTREHRDIATELAQLATRAGTAFVMDGELVEDGDRAVFHPSDLLLEGGDVLVDQPWSARRDALERLLKRRRVKHVALEPVDDDAEAVLRRAARAAAPGLLAHRIDAPYRPGAKSDGLLRITMH